MLYLELNKGKNPLITWFEGAHFSSKCVRVSWHHFDYRGFEFEEWIQIDRKHLSDQHFRNLKNFLGRKKDLTTGKNHAMFCLLVNIVLGS